MRHAIVVAVVSTTIAVLPIFLLAGLAVLVRQDLNFGQAELGALVAVFFAMSAVSSIPSGRISQRLGPTRTMVVAAHVTALSLLGIAVAQTWAHLLAIVLLAGVSNGAAQVGSNHLLTQSVPRLHQGLAFGVKQASVPLASTVGGLALPLMGLSVGWRPAFICAAIAAFVFPLTVARASRSLPSRTSFGSVRRLPLAILAVGVGFGGMAANSVAPFLVEGLVAKGFTLEASGLVLALGSLLGMLVRILSGWLADRSRRAALLYVAALLCFGAGGFALLALDHGPTVAVLGAMLALGGGWGWAGLLWLGVARANSESPALAMGVVSVGPFAGGVVGPLVFGLLAEHTSYGYAWAYLAVASVLAATLVAISQPMLRETRSADCEGKENP